MHIKEKFIIEFQKLYKQEFNEQISYDEALTQCIAMVRLHNIIFKPITKHDLTLLDKFEKCGNV